MCVLCVYLFIRIHLYTYMYIYIYEYVFICFRSEYVSVIDQKTYTCKYVFAKRACAEYINIYICFAEAFMARWALCHNYIELGQIVIL